MSEYSVCTSMSEEYWKDMGERMYQSFIDNWDAPLKVYSEDDFSVVTDSLKIDEDWVEFQKNAPDESKDYRYKAKTFSHKVFAITNPPDVKWWIWLDADVITEHPVDEEWLKTVCPEDATLSYLGRKDWRHSECGWVAYNLEKARPFLEEFRRIYTSGEIYTFPEWHDSYIFDRVRERIPGNYHNLSEGISGMHPWDESPLGEKMRHLKGPLRKKGKSLEGLPDGYKSEIEIQA